jgi:hypothetical protein
VQGCNPDSAVVEGLWRRLIYLLIHLELLCLRDAEWEQPAALEYARGTMAKAQEISMMADVCDNPESE